MVYKIFSAADPLDVAQILAEHIATCLQRVLQHKDTALVVFSTGSTPLQTYGVLQRRHREALPWHRVRVCQLDEYAGLTQADPRSFQGFLLRHIVTPLGTAFRSLSGQETDAEMLDYEQEILDRGGLDLVVYGVGVNGHLGFNEPGTPFDAASACVALHPSTRARVPPEFTTPPTHAVTLGLRVLNAGRAIRLMALGESKRAALEAGLLAPPTPQVPLSSLQSHPDVQFYFDRAACPEGLLAL